MLSDGEISLIENILKSKTPQTMEEYLIRSDGTENTQNTGNLLSYLREGAPAERIRRIECVLSSRQTAAIEFLLRQDDDNGNFLDTYINSSKDDATKIERIYNIIRAINRRTSTVLHLLKTIEPSSRDSNPLSLLMWCLSKISEERFQAAVTSLVQLDNQTVIRTIQHQARSHSHTQNLGNLPALLHEQIQARLDRRYFNTRPTPQDGERFDYDFRAGVPPRRRGGRKRGGIETVSLGDEKDSATAGEGASSSLSSKPQARTPVTREEATTKRPRTEESSESHGAATTSRPSESPPAKRRTKYYYPIDIIQGTVRRTESTRMTEGTSACHSSQPQRTHERTTPSSQQPQDHPPIPTSCIGRFFGPGAQQRESLRSTSAQQDPEEVRRNEEIPTP